MKTIVICCILNVLSASSFAQVTVKLKIENAEKNGKNIYLSVFNLESTYKTRNVFTSLVINAKYETVTNELSLPVGQYVFSVFQDSNDNGKLDTNLIGIPREKFGFSNYDGKSAPGSYNSIRL